MSILVQRGSSGMPVIGQWVFHRMGKCIYLDIVCIKESSYLRQ